MRLFSYKMTHDSGFAPNPFHGVLTLATCKPGIRRTKKPGDWVAGFSSKTLRNLARKEEVNIDQDALLWLGRVTEVVPLNRYFHDRRFRLKRPRGPADPGDNIYRPLTPQPAGPDEYEQLRNSSHGPREAEHDVGGKNALIFEEFFYLGRQGMPVHEDIRIARPSGPTCYGYKTEREETICDLIRWVRKTWGEGQIGLPCLSIKISDSGHECGKCGK